MLELFTFTEHKMTKQIERIYDVITGKTIERELTEIEIAALADTIPEHAKETS